MRDVKQFIIEQKLVVIVRKMYGDKLIHLAQALYEGGIRLIEVTFDQADSNCTENTCNAIAALKAEMGSRMEIGAGTVLTPEQVSAAAKAGATYIISPNTSERVIRQTKELGLVSIPAAMTPTEMAFAHECGADIIKVFPFANLGIAYMKNVMAPLAHLKFLAAAGVTEENFGDILDAGLVGAGVSGRLTDRKAIDSGDFAEITRRAKAFCDIAGRN